MARASFPRTVKTCNQIVNVCNLSIKARNFEFVQIVLGFRFCVKLFRVTMVKENTLKEESN